jgi:simple sugar transport system ATP-binding protein
MTSQPMLETRNLTKSFGAFTAVAGVSLAFSPGQIHAVLGENGAGKSTLMKLLFGLHRPSGGEILLDGEKVHWRSSMSAIMRGLGMVQQHFSLVDTLSAIDNIMLGAEECRGPSFIGRLDRRQAIVRLEKLLPSSSLVVPWDTPVGALTVGQKQRVEILKLLFRESRILFLDEPTAVLTPSEIEDLFSVLRELKKQGRTIVLITHKINEVLHTCDTYTVLRAGKLIARGQVKDVTIDHIVESMIGRRLPAFDVERNVRAATKVLECRGVREESRAGKGAKSDNGVMSRGKLNDISLVVHAGEIVGVAGVDGSGQSRLVEALFGLRSVSGSMRVLDHDIAVLSTRQVRHLGVGLVPEDRHHQGLWLEESCFTNMVIGIEENFLRGQIFKFRELEKTTAEWAREFDVRASSLSLPVGRLSGGNQQKVIFAREVSGRQPKLLVCHQPTRGVDLGAIDLIHRKLLELRNNNLGVLVLSSELDELLKLCDRIYVFFEGRVVSEFARPSFDRMRIGAAMTGVRNEH